MKLTPVHKQALLTSAILVAILLLVYFIVQFFHLNNNYLYLGISVVFIYFIIYFIVRKNIKQFMFRQLKSIYDDSTLFENNMELQKKSVESDFKSCINSIKEFVNNKHLEIEKLHNRDDFRKDFLGDVSHELKTPIFTAQGYILTLLDESFNDKTLRKKYLERANKSIERLNFIVKDLDMISKLESGMDLHFESFNLLKLIAEVFDILEIKAAKKNISLVFDKVYESPILVTADKERIEQVLINLISNSINYGKENGFTTLSVESFSDERVLIRVIDDGIGIPKKELNRLFERFYRIDKSRSRGQGGSGLGLAIVKHIIEAHEQKVFVQSELKNGSVFSFTLNKVL